MYTKLSLTKQNPKTKVIQKVSLYYNTPKLKEGSILYRKTGTTTFVYAAQGTLSDWRNEGWTN